MPFAAWARLERISARIEELHRHRLFAERLRNFDRALELAREIIMAEAQHHLLADVIVAHLVERGVTPGLCDPELLDPTWPDPRPLDPRQPDDRKEGAGNCAG